MRRAVFGHHRDSTVDRNVLRRADVRLGFNAAAARPHDRGEGSNYRHYESLGSQAVHTASAALAAQAPRNPCSTIVHVSGGICARPILMPSTADHCGMKISTGISARRCGG